MTDSKIHHVYIIHIYIDTYIYMYVCICICILTLTHVYIKCTHMLSACFTETYARIHFVNLRLIETSPLRPFTPGHICPDAYRSDGGKHQDRSHLRPGQLPRDQQLIFSTLTAGNFLGYHRVAGHRVEGYHKGYQGYHLPEGNPYQG